MAVNQQHISAPYFGPVRGAGGQLPLQRFASMPSMSQYQHHQHFLPGAAPLAYSSAPHLNFTYQNPVMFSGFQQTTMPIPPHQYPVGQTLVSPFGSFGTLPLPLPPNLGNGLQIPATVGHGPVKDTHQQYLMATPPGSNKKRPMSIDGNDNKRPKEGNLRNVERDSGEDSDTFSSNTEEDDDQEESKSNGASTVDSTVARVKGPWTIKEDAKLKQFVKQYGKRWSLVAEKLPGRIGKQCRERWLNHLDPKINRAPWTPEEDRILLSKQKVLGNRWSEIAKLLPGRPENSVKNRFTSLSQRTFGV